MSIIIEEQKSKSGIASVLIWLVFIVLVGVGAFYVFFKKPESIKIPLPQNLEDTKKLAGLKLNPAEVVGSEKFQSLKPYINIPEARTDGRANPFMSFDGALTPIR